MDTGPKIALVRFQSQYAPDVEQPLNALFVSHNWQLHEAVAGVESWVGSFPVNLDAEAINPGAGVVAFKQRPDQLTVLYIDPASKQLHAQWRFRNSDPHDPNSWHGPAAILPPHPPAPSGASLAVAAQGPNRWFVVFADKHGDLYSASVDGGGAWNHFQRLTPLVNDFAEPGGNVVAIEQAPGLVSALFVARQSRRVHVCWREADAAAWSGPAPIHSMLPAAPPGAGMAAARLPGDRWWVFYVDDNDTLTANRVTGRDPWQKPEVVSAPYTAPAGAFVAAINQTDWLINAFVVGWDGALLRYWRAQDATHWSGPLKLTPDRFAPPGAPVTAAKQNDDVTVVVVAASDGRPHICWVVGTGDWQGPARISWSRVIAPDVPDAPAGQNPTSVYGPTPEYVTGTFFPASTVRLAQLTGPGTLNPLEPWVGSGADLGANADQPGVDLGANTDHKVSARDPGRLYIFAGDVRLKDYVRDPDLSPPWDADPVAYTDETAIRPGGFSLRVVSDLVRAKPPAQGFTSVFHPFTVERLGPLTTDETPTGAFSYDGRAYVFFVAGGGAVPVSYLASSDRPDQPATFALRFKFSSSKFWQVAPVVVRNADHPGLPTQTEDGLVMIGHGPPWFGAPENIYLAWMPLERGRLPDRAQILFYAGAAPEEQGHRFSWSPREDDAAPLFTPPPGYTAVSLAWLPEPQRWILVYSLAKSPKDPNPARDARGPIMARVAASLMRWSDEIKLFDQKRDLPPRADSIWKDGESWAYGAFIVRRFTQWDPARSRVRIRYFLSLFRPYQIQLMESQIHLPDVPFWRRVVQTIIQFLLRGVLSVDR
jgi:hypothetical protein